MIREIIETKYCDAKNTDIYSRTITYYFLGFIPVYKETYILQCM